MRKRHWLACLLSMWLSVVGGQAIAQPPPPPLPNDVSNPDRTGMLPAPYSANYGTYGTYGSYPQAPTGGIPGGYPPNATAWPNVSPFAGPPVDQTVNQNGLWFNRQLFGNRKYYVNVEGLITHTGRPNSQVGANNVNIVPNIAPGTIYPDNNQQFQETPAGTSTLGTPDRETLSGGGAVGGGAVGGAAGATGGGGDVGVFLTQTTSQITDTLGSAGFRGTWGFWNVDNSGFQVQGFVQSQASTALFIGGTPLFDPTLYTQSTFLQTEELNLLHAIAGIPLAGADTDHNGLPGVVQPFDIYYRLQYTSQLGGFNADWIASPILERPALKIRPMYGARYMQLQETFQFDGADSGLGYTINTPSSAQGGGAVAGGAGNGVATSTGSGYLSPATLEALSTLNVMQSLLVSKVTSQLAGPEAGLRFDLGKENFNVYTVSKLGLLVDVASRNLSGYNIGDAYYPATNGTLANPTVMPRGNGALTHFYHEDQTTILSPMFEQGVFAKAKVFGFVPILKKSKILSEAEFQAGYTMILVGNTYRPSNTINWQAYPVSPLLANNRSTYFTENVSFGIQWNY